MKAHRKARYKGVTNAADKLAHRLKLEADDRLKNDRGGGDLPLPSTLGWGIRKSTKKVSLFDPFKGGK
jgi:hypothetical protein